MSLRSPYYGGFPGPPSQASSAGEQNQVNRHQRRTGQEFYEGIRPQFVDHGVAPFHSWQPGHSFVPGNPSFQFPRGGYGVPPAGVFYSQPDFISNQQEFFRPGLVDQRLNYMPHHHSRFSNPQNVHNSEVSPTLEGNQSSISDTAGKPRRFSRQRTSKENNAGSSGEVPSKSNDTKGTSAIRFSHQKEESKAQKKDNRLKLNANADSFVMSPNDQSQSTSSSPKTNLSEKKQKSNPETKGKMLKSKYKKTETTIEDGSQAGVLLDQLSSGMYECMVCCDRVKQHHAVWNCPMCYNLFHMGCIKKWARSPAAKIGESSLGWRCPGCQNVTQQVPNTYFCFCGKEKNPEWKKGEIPHSCGENCSKARKDHPGCTHPCNILCHPGPCPSCPAMIKRHCKCTKTRTLVRCSQQSNLVCQEPCGKFRNCGEHRCQEICHSAPCDDCDVIVGQECFCAKRSREVICGSEDSKASKLFTGGCYECGEKCDKLLSCENHHCEANCHPGDCKPCSLLPSLVKLCPCTQTRLEDLKDENGSVVERKSCLDPIPTCAKVCGKPLKCGGEEVHTCKLPCHIGECPPCEEGESTIKCRCGKSEKEVTCREFVAMETYICDRRCNKKRKCGRHKCGQTCCTEIEHTCSQLCGRKLTCGIHRCEDPCHRGTCHTCYDVSFDELRCYCGDKVLLPPIACGTKAPECSNECTRLHPCSHPVRHNCHIDEFCPPCVELVRKKCNCGKVVRGNIMCHIDNVSCGTPCHKTLPCGHKCAKPCHRGSCTETGEPCTQPCSIMRGECIHPCANPCHYGAPCPPTPCKAMVTLRCPCGRREEQAECSAGRRDSFHGLSNPALSGASSANGVDIEKLLRSGATGTRSLQCNADCSIAERNRRLAAALDIKDADLSARPQQEYSDFLKAMAKNDGAFIRTIEQQLVNLVETVDWMGALKQTHSFQVMKRDKRQAVHELAEAFHCKSESRDVEPNRNVTVTATRGTSKAPVPLLSDVIMEKATSEKVFINNKPASSAKGRPISSMKFVSLKSEGPTRSNSSSSCQNETKRVGHPVRKPFSASDPPASNPTYKAPMLKKYAPVSTYSRFEALSLGNSAASSSTGPSSSSSAPPIKASTLPPEPKIDYFDMTD